jgi:competence protein ComEC
VYVVDAWNRLDLRAEAGPRKWLNNGLLLLCISVAVALATGPLVAHHFNQASFAGIIANMVVVPFAGAVVVPLGLFSGVLSVFTGDLPLAALVQAVADAFVALVSLFSALPGAMVRLPSPGPLFLAGYAGIVIAGAVWGRSLLFARFRPLEFPSRTPRSALITAAVASLLLLAAAASPLIRGGATRVTFIDVGQGDSALVETAGGAAILIDGGGTRDNRFAVGRRIVSPYLADRGVRSLDLVVLSHPHPDHMNGLLTIVEDFRVREVWWSGHDGHLEGFEDLRRKLEERHVPLRRVAAGSSAVIGDAVLDVIYPAGNPLAGKQRAYAAENDRSLVVRLRVEARTFLFPGDLHRESEAVLIALGRDISADVLKVPHHGSRSSSMSAFVRAVGPSMAVISVGAGNPYHHPAEEVIDRYRSAGAEIHRTDRDGAVIIEVRGATLAATRWTDLQLQKFDVGRVSRWGGQERENWRKVWIRTTGI